MPAQRIPWRVEINDPGLWSNASQLVNELGEEGRHPSGPRRVYLVCPVVHLAKRDPAHFLGDASVGEVGREFVVEKDEVCILVLSLQLRVDDVQQMALDVQGEQVGVDCESWGISGRASK